MSGAWRIYLAVGAVVAAAYFFAPKGLGHHAIYDTIGASSIIAILLGIRRHRPANALPWYLFAYGNLAFVVGDGIRAFYETTTGQPAPFPGLADVAYIAAYPILIAGVVLLVRNRDKVRDRGNLVDALLIATSAGLLFWVYLIRPYTENPELHWLETTISVAYPLLDLVLLGVAARLMFSPGRRSPAYYLLAGSLAALLTADSFYTVTLLNGTYHTGSPVDAGWLISYLLWGAAALHPSMSELANPLPQSEDLTISRQRMMVLGAASLLAPFVRIFETLRHQDLPPFTTVLPTVILFVLVMVRMSLLVRALSSALERHELAERRRRQSEARFGSLVQHASDVVLVAGGGAPVGGFAEGGEITFQSPSVQRVLGFRPDEHRSEEHTSELQSR